MSGILFLFKCLYFLANLAAGLMRLLWKLAKRFCSSFSKYCLYLWWILGFLGFLIYLFIFILYSSMRWSNEVCLWIQRKDLNLTEGSRFFFCCCFLWTKTKHQGLQMSSKACCAIGCSWELSARLHCISAPWQPVDVSSTQLSPLRSAAWQWPSWLASSARGNLPFVCLGWAAGTAFRWVDFGDVFLRIRDLFNPFLANQPCQAKASEQLRSLFSLSAPTRSL